MEFWILFILRVSLMAIPLYLCNSLALVFGGKTPIDGERKFFDGRPLLGRGKTFFYIIVYFINTEREF